MRKTPRQVGLPSDLSRGVILRPEQHEGELHQAERRFGFWLVAPIVANNTIKSLMCLSEDSLPIGGASGGMVCERWMSILWTIIVGSRLLAADEHDPILTLHPFPRRVQLKDGLDSF